MKKNKKWGGGSFKYLIPGIIAVILLSGVLLSNKFITKQNLGSIYNIDEAGDNFDNIQIGDEINYEVNGYSDWQVIGKDDYNGTIDVVSKTNTEDLTLEYGQSKEYYENKFQETANKYIDNNYAISARTVNQSDLYYFNYEEDFWLNSFENESIVLSNGSYQYNNIKNYKVYIIPRISKDFPNASQYEIGDNIEYSHNGIEKWIVEYKNSSTLYIIPETPIEIIIDSKDDDLISKIDEIKNDFNKDVNYFGDISNINKITTLIPNFLNLQSEKIFFVFFDGNNYGQDGNKIIYGSTVYSYENGELKNNPTPQTIYTDSNPYTLGYRPVVTLKAKEEIKDMDKKEISSILQVGDYVKYEAKGYRNWKVLGVDKDLGTVDIISGGIVKNITLSGKEDWDNYEDIIQREVDEYKNGNQAIQATSVTSSHFKTLKEIDKTILSRYWLLSKSSYLKEITHYRGEGKLFYYSIGSIYLFDVHNFEMQIDNIAIALEYIASEESQKEYQNKSDYNINSYTAGLRPVITLKLDSVEKLPEEEAKKIEETTEKQEKVFIKEQESKNKNYKGPSKVDDSTSSTGNNNEVKINDNDNTKKDNITDNNTSNVEKIIYKDKPFYKYGFYILLVICLIETLLLIIPKINKK